MSLEIPIPSLLNLPADVSFSQKNGRANIDVSREGDVIHITATCDSLQALVEYYERELTRIRNDTSAEETVIKNERSTGIQNPFKLFFYGFFSGVLAVVISTVFTKIKK